MGRNRENPAAAATADRVRIINRAVIPIDVADTTIFGFGSPAAHCITHYPCPPQEILDWLIGLGIDPMALAKPLGVRFARGYRAHDGIFEDAADGGEWLVFEGPNDVIYWHPATGALATRWNRAFALGEEIIDQAATCSFDCNLNIFNDPIEWLRNMRDGIVVLDWDQAFERLRDCPRVAVAEKLLETYQRAMRPKHLPELFVLVAGRIAA